jgi:large subunit ribosomal protein L25
MANQATLQAHSRSNSGKGAARSLRRSGLVPGVIYGHHRQPESLQIEAPALTRLLVGAHTSTLVDVTVDSRTPVKALIREIQRNPLRSSTIVHIDLYEVRADEKVAVEVAIRLVGTPDGVRNFGGVLDQQMHTLHIRALPADIPELIEVDVTNLGIGQSLHVSDLTFDKGDILSDAGQTLAVVAAPRVEETVAPVAEVPASTEPELIRKAKADAETEEKAK